MKYKRLSNYGKLYLLQNYKSNEIKNLRKIHLKLNNEALPKVPYLS